MNKITPDILRQSDWFFGVIPEHWRAIPLKHLCKRVSVYGANISSKEYQPEGVRFIRTSDIRDDGRLKNGGVFLPQQKVSWKVSIHREQKKLKKAQYIVNTHLSF